MAAMDIGQARVLVAESSAEMRLHLNRLLRKDGYEAREPGFNVDGTGVKTTSPKG
jgi:hypothetical protein